MAISAKEAFVIGGLEFAAGLFETIIIPNFGRKEGEKFVLPAKGKIGITALVLTGSGVITGYMADFLLDQMNIGEDESFKRMAIIASTALTFNAVESILIDNIVKHDFTTEKWEMPALRKFAANFALLAASSILVGYFSTQIIASINPQIGATSTVDATGGGVLANKPTT